jgi:DNA-binding response OmpR family regulator
MAQTILVVDDEKDLVELVRYNLQRSGFHVLAAGNGSEALELAFRRAPNLVVLDVMMPEMDGLEVCRLLRADSRTRTIPLIMLTAKVAETDRVVGLELGADDYLAKPFSPRELIARIKSLLRRADKQFETQPSLRCGQLLIDTDRHEVRYAGHAVTVTATEFRVLEYMMRQPGRVFSRDQIISGALGQDAVVTDRAVDVHMTALRRKLGDGAYMIETIRGFGYRVCERDDPPPS